MRDNLPRIHHLFCLIDESVSEYVLQKVVQARRSPLYVWNNSRAMREQVVRIHHLFCLIEESVSEYVF